MLVNRNFLSDNVNMTTAQENLFTLYEKVRHVAFRCGCVRTFKEHEGGAAQCPRHHSPYTSITEEYRPALRLAS